MAEALPVSGVMVGGEALSLSDRAALAEQRTSLVAKVQSSADDRRLGLTRALVYNLYSVTGNPSNSVAAVEEIPLFTVPFDGFITEVNLELSGGATPYALGFKTSSGQSFFSTLDMGVVIPTGGTPEPDMLPLGAYSITNSRLELRNLRVPVFGGEQIIARALENPLFPGGAQMGSGVMVCEAYLFAQPGSAAAMSQFGALLTQTARANSDAQRYASQIEIERERTRRAQLEAQARIEVAKLAAQKPVQASNTGLNPFNLVLADRAAQSRVQSRAPVLPPPQPAFAPPSATLDGAGKTFVAAWAPTANSIGYLVPNPPPGARVNVFDGKYTIWGASGAKLGEGLVENVRTDAEIPAEARVSRNLGVTPSSSMALSTFTPGEGFAPTQLAPGPSGRLSLQPR